MILSLKNTIRHLEDTVLTFVNDNRDRSVAVWTILFSLVAQGFRWFNAYFFHDSLIIHQADGSQQALLGRFLVPFWLLVRGKIATPLLIAFISVCFLCLANILIVKLLDIRRRSHIVLLCALVAASPSITCLYAYFIPSTDIHTLAILLATGSVWLLCRFRWGWIPASFCLAGSMALYESYAEVAVLLLFLLVIKDLVQDRKQLLTPGKMRGTAAFLVLGGLLFLAGWVVTARYLSGTGISKMPTAGDYNSVNRLGDLRFSNLFPLLKGTYVSFLEYVTFPETRTPRLIGALNLLLAVGACALAATSTRKPAKIPAIAAAFVLIPLGTNFVYLLTGGLVHCLMVFSFTVLYAGVLMCIEFDLPGNIEKGARRGIHTAARVLSLIALCVIAFNFVVFANQSHLKMALEGQATLSVMTRVIDRMEQAEGYEPGVTPVVIVGDLNKSAVAQDRNGYDTQFGRGPQELRQASQWKGNYFSMTYFQGYESYFKNVLGYPFNGSDTSTMMRFSGMPEVIGMPAFPSQGCVMMLRDTLVVKLSDSGFEVQTNP